jgi:Cu(I)/Ag(I) efflux system membrane fusion protein/cobalt-zinc-cadmium efflux system membrane fusion protein
VILLVAGVALVAGLAGGRWLWGTAGAPGQQGTSASESTAGDDEQWYTCGMHPNVLQKGPGECPICHMKLTPLKKADEGGSASGGGTSERRVLYWRAPMDPNYISDKPGRSPMGMDLVPVYANEDESPSAHTIRIDPVTIQNMGIRTEVVKRGPLVKIIRTVGRVDYDEQLVAFINTKFKGWIERLYVDETGQHVARGQPLFDVYSPELYAAQEEYLAAVRNLPLLEGSTFAPATEEAARLVEAAVTKLRYMDVSEEQIARIRETKQVEKTLTMHSPADGIVTEKMALEGMYVMPGMRLYTIADLSHIWVYVDTYEYQLPWVYASQPARMTLPYVPGREFLGKVVYVYPYLEQQTRVIKVRLEFENPALELKPGMYANVKLESQFPHEALLIPRAAYIDSGERKVAFVDRGGGKFEPREIQTGVEAEEGMVEVLHGLDKGEVVVTSGQFLLDAESKLKEAVAKMMEAERAKTTKRAPDSETSSDHAMPHDHAAGRGMVEHKTMPHDAAYACPMEEHPDVTDPTNRGPYFSPKSGECPRCGMKLKPLDQVPWTKEYMRHE